MIGEDNKIPPNLRPSFFVESFKNCQKKLDDEEQYVQFCPVQHAFDKLQNRHCLFVYNQGNLHLRPCLEWLYMDRMTLKPIKSKEAAINYINHIIHEDIANNSEKKSLLKYLKNHTNTESSNVSEILNNQIKEIETLQFIFFSDIHPSLVNSFTLPGVELVLSQTEEGYELESVLSPHQDLDEHINKFRIEYPPLSFFTYLKGPKRLEVQFINSKQLNSNLCQKIYNSFGYTLERQLKLHSLLRQEFELERGSADDICHRAGFVNLCWMIQKINIQLASEDQFTLLNLLQIKPPTQIKQIRIPELFHLNCICNVMLNIGLSVLTNPKEIAYLRYPLHYMFRQILYYYYSNSSVNTNCSQAQGQSDKKPTKDITASQQVSSSHKNYYRTLQDDNIYFCSYYYLARIPLNCLQEMKKDGIFVYNSGFIDAYFEAEQLSNSQTYLPNCLVSIKVPLPASLQCVNKLVIKHGLKIADEGQQSYLSSMGYYENRKEENKRWRLLVNPQNLFKVVKISQPGVNEQYPNNHILVLQLQEMVKIDHKKAAELDKCPNFQAETQQNKAIITNVIAYQPYLQLRTQILRTVKTQQDAIELLNGTKKLSSSSVRSAQISNAETSLDLPIVPTAQNNSSNEQDNVLRSLMEQMSQLLETAITKQKSHLNQQIVRISQINFKLRGSVMKIIKKNYQNGSTSFKSDPLTHQFLSRYLEFRYSLASYLPQEGENISIAEALRQWSRVNHRVISNFECDVDMMSDLLNSYLRIYDSFVQENAKHMEPFKDFYTDFFSGVIILQNYLAGKLPNSPKSDQAFRNIYMQLLYLVGKVFKLKILPGESDSEMRENSEACKDELGKQLLQMNISQPGKACLLAAFPDKF